MKLHPSLAASVFALATLSTAATAKAAVIFGSAEVYANAYAGSYVQRTRSSGVTVSSSGSQYASDADASNSLPADPLLAEAAAANSSTVAAGNTASASAEEATKATFASADTATFDFSGATSTAINLLQGNTYASAYAYGYGSSLYYNFSTDADSTLNVAYDLSESSPYYYYYYNNYFQMYDYTSGYYLYSSYLGSNTTGNLMMNLTAGHDYQMYIYAGYYNDYTDNYLYGPGSSSTSGSHHEIYDWAITAAPTGAVPEPATWGLMVGGFGLMGAAMRRRRRTLGYATA
jgi:hypothetical protein